MELPSPRLKLDPKQRQHLRKRARHERDHRITRRILTLLWLDQGRTEAEVADLLNVDPRSIRNWLKLYRTGGLDALCTLKHKGDKGELTGEQQRQLRDEVKTGRFRTVKHIREWIEHTFAVAYSDSGVKRLLQRLGCTYHKASGYLFKARRDKQEEWLRKYEGHKGQVGRTLRRYFIDGVHPVWGQESLFNCWLIRGQRLEVPVGSGRKRLNILGAFCPDDHEYLDRRYVKENLTARSVIALFERMMAMHPEVKVFLIYLDNAKYHHAVLVKEWMERVRQEKGVAFELEYLPSYSPNLNLIERLWRFLRKEALQRWHETFESMESAVAGVLDNLERYREAVRSLMRERFRLVPEQPTSVIV
ncbi:MAG TPA: IS630 family transposase [Isosphaeraceae bacterium]|nr:IS630 family transposase [Isosphaeraceae bacterium]